MSSLLPPPFLFPPLLHLISGYPDQLLALEQVSTGIGEKVPKNLCCVNIPLLDQLSVWLNNLLTHRPTVCSIHSQGHTARFQNWVHTVVPKSCMSNMLSAKEYTHVVVRYLEKEQKSNIIIQVGTWPEQLGWEFMSGYSGHSFRGGTATTVAKCRLLVTCE